MRPNSRETTACATCGASIFYALTQAGKKQALDALPHPDGSVMAYRGVRVWLARTPRRTGPVEAGQQLALDQVADLVDDPRDAPGHPLEEAFRPHAETCAGAPRALFDVPAPRPSGRAGRPSPVIYGVKGGGLHNPPADGPEGAQVFDWAKHAPRLAARRRAVRPSAAGQ